MFQEKKMRTYSQLKKKRVLSRVIIVIILLMVESKQYTMNSNWGKKVSYQMYLMLSGFFKQKKEENKLAL